MSELKIQIKSIFGSVLFEYTKKKETDGLKEAVLEAIKSRANLYGADLSVANLYGADLSRANLSRADLSGADLYGADLYGADLSRADLSRADLSGANLSGADLSGANLSRANLSGADLSGAKIDDLETIFNRYFRITPDGDLIGWKKLQNGIIAMLKIPAEAKRTNSILNRKCRAEWVEVIELQTIEGKKCDAEIGIGQHDHKTEYKAGHKVYPDKYDGDLTKDCTHGIHFFITRQEAVDY